MIPPEFKVQVFQTADQWRSGLLYKLEHRDGRITLFSRPAFSGWLESPESAWLPGSGLAVDRCGQIYWLEGKQAIRGSKTEINWHLYRYDPKNRLKEEITVVWKSEACTSHEACPTRMLIDRLTLWLVEQKGRILAYSTEHFQLKYVIERHGVGVLIDMALDSKRHLYVLEQDQEKKYRICKYTRNGQPVYRTNSGKQEKVCFGSKQLKNPIALAVGKQDPIHVIDKVFNAETNTTRYVIRQFSADGQEPRKEVDLPGQFLPSSIAVGRDGVVFVAGLLRKQENQRQEDEKQRPAVQLLDPDGSHLGELELHQQEMTPGEKQRRIEEIYQIAFDSQGGLFLLTNAGIAVFGLQSSVAGEEGVYYSKTLDSGQQGREWHRLQLQGNFPPRTKVEIYHQASDDPLLKNSVERILADKQSSVQKKEHDLENLLRATWSKPESFEGSDGSARRERDAPATSSSQKADDRTVSLTQDMLFTKNTGRYLWLKLALSTFDEKAKPAISEMRLYHPRISYLRYLPATYQENPVSRAFLERFLSLFETVLFGLEREIDEVSKYFDPGIAPKEFLSWLGGWLNFSLEEEWPEAQKRKLISRAWELFRKKGTPAGLATFLQVYTGREAVILEHSRMAAPLILGRGFHLGLNSFVSPATVRDFRLGDSSILGRTAIRSGVQQAEDPFLQRSHRFTILLGMDAEESSKYERGIRRILEDQSPAHTQYTLRLMGEAGFGQHTYVGISTKVTDYRPFRLGVTSHLGRVVAAAKGEKGDRLERSSRLAGAIELT